MSTSNTLTKNDLKKVLEKISIGSGGVIDADDMTQAEINNFLEDINAQGKSSEYRKLLWTNPSPTVAFAAQTISLDLSDYDVVQIDAYLTANGMISTRFTAVGFQGEAGGLGSAGDRYTRNVNVTTTGVAFTVGRSNGTESASACIPYKIYGIKYEHVAPPQIEIVDYIVEQGTSDIWTYRKWASGIAECWGTKTTNSVTFSQWSSLPWYYAYITGVALPFTFVEIPVVTHHCYTTGGDIYVAGGASTTNQGGLPSTTNTGGITLYRAAVSTLSITTQYYVIGRWK